MKFRILSFLAFSLITLPLLRADNIRWLKTEYDFGTFKEVDGKKTGSLQFVNEGSAPTIITRVKPTCGCTVAEYTEGEIAPGDTATVSFTYNPAGRPGRFLKHIRVFTGEDNQMSQITIKGTVIGAPQTLAADYPVEAGGLRLSTDTLNMGHIVKGKARNEFIHGYNQSSDTIILGWKDVPKKISLGVSSMNITPGDLFTMSFYLHATDQLEVGENYLNLTLLAQEAGNKTTEIPFVIKCIIDEDFSNLTPEQMKEAPVANLYPTVVDLETVTEKDKSIKTKVNLTNDGKTPLQVRRIYSPQLALKSSTKAPLTIKPGQTKEIEVEIDGSSIPGGLFNIPVEILCDDPLRSNVSFRLVGTRK